LHGEVGLKQSVVERKLLRLIAVALLFALMSMALATDQRVSTVPETVVVPSGKLSLKAFLWKPAGPGPFPAVLFCHGSGGADAVHSWSADVQLYLAVGARIIIGLLLFFAAPSCRLPRFTRVVGVVVLLAGIVFAFIGASRLASMVGWVLAQPNWMIQLLYALTVVLGSFLMFSGSSKKNVV